MFPFVIGMIMGPYVRWGKDDIFLILSRIKKILLIFFSIVSLLIWYLNYKDPILSIIFITMGSWIILSSLFEIFKFSKGKLMSLNIPKKIFAQVFAHIGIGLLIIGATGSSILNKKRFNSKVLGSQYQSKVMMLHFLA